MIDLPRHEDPWAWLHSHGEEDGPHRADVEVTAIVEPRPGVDAARCRAAVEAGEPAPHHVVVEDIRGDQAGEWLWLLPADCEPAPTALHALLVTLERRPELDVVGPLLVEPRRRGPGTIVRQFGQTVTATGRIRGLVPPGELYQGQLQTTDSLATADAGMLVRGETWRALGGFNRALPADYRGAEFCWRARLAGHEVAVEPSAQVVSDAEPPDAGDSRAAGLALVAAHLPRGRRLLGRLWLVLTSLLAALGYLLGKAPGKAAAEFAGLGRWLARRSVRRSLTVSLRGVASAPGARARIRQLRPRPGSGTWHFIEGVGERIAEWGASFAGPGQAVSLDELTGDDFAARGQRRAKAPVLLIGGLAAVGLAVAAGRFTFGTGSLQAERLLPAPAGWLDLLGGYLDPVPGTAALAGPAWTGLTALGSLIAGGQPEWLVGLFVLGCVPLAWFAAYRFLRQGLASATMAALGASGYAIAPVMTGAIGAGAVGVAVWAVFLPVFGYSLRGWLADDPRLWRRAAATGLSALLLVAVVPLAWAALVLAMVVVIVRHTRAWLRAVLVAVAPLLLVVGPWRDTLLAYPGRLLTGIEPTLAGTAAVEPWQVLLGRGSGSPPPLWLSIVVFGGLWLIAGAGALRRGGRATAALAVAGASAVVALLLTRLLVWVPPGEWVRPDALEWQVAVVAGLVLAGAWGLDGLAEELRGANLGLRHAGALLLTGLSIVVVAVSAGWWVLAGQSGLHRGPVNALPPFVRNAQLSETPGRTLALDFTAEQVGWVLLADAMPRFGDAERGLVFSGDAEGAELAASVAGRLVAGTADDELLTDLRRLGVSYIWLRGGGADHQLAISNTPGLGIGTADGDTMVWPVPDSARAVVLGDDGGEPVGDGASVTTGRELLLAEPADPRWQVTVGDRPLVAEPGAGPGQVYPLQGATGTLRIALPEPLPWAWVQLGGLVALLLLAAPGLRRPRESSGPRRVASRAMVDEVASAPRRAAGGER
ncbi:MAG: hypothetical protein LCH76_05865 [Actinobacteria bacterium]|nr:hypothetical protein [Actinomycetota bacterium]